MTHKLLLFLFFLGNCFVAYGWESKELNNICNRNDVFVVFFNGVGNT